LLAIAVSLALTACATGPITPPKNTVMFEMKRTPTEIISGLTKFCVAENGVIGDITPNSVSCSKKFTGCAAFGMAMVYGRYSTTSDQLFCTVIHGKENSSTVVVTRFIVIQRGFGSGTTKEPNTFNPELERQLMALDGK